MNQRVIEVGGLEFDAWDDGGPDRPAVLMLHGFPQDHRCWQSWVDPLLEQGYRVIRPDQRGYSPDARPLQVAAYRLSHLVDDARGVLDALGIDRVHVVGHDWGGAVAWGLASRYPERLESLTVLSTPHPRALIRSLGRSRQLAMSWYMAVLQWPDLAYRLLAPGGPAWPSMARGLPSTLRDAYALRAQDREAFDGMIAWYRAMLLDARRPSLHWKPISTPTLYAWGMRDPALGIAAALLTAQEVVGPYEFIALARHGHWLPERGMDLLMPQLLEHLTASRA